MNPPKTKGIVTFYSQDNNKAAAEVTESLRPSETNSGDMEKAAKLMPAVDEEYARTIAAIKEL